MMKELVLYVPVVDTGVDVIAEKIENGTNVYLALQVKACERQQTQLWGWTVDPKTFRVSKNSYLIAVILDPPKELVGSIDLQGSLLNAFVVPSAEYDIIASRRSERWIKKGDWGPGLRADQFLQGEFSKYLNNWVPITGS
jgi:hypothetical protein